MQNNLITLFLIWAILASFGVKAQTPDTKTLASLDSLIQLSKSASIKKDHPVSLQYARQALALAGRTVGPQDERYAQCWYRMGTGLDGINKLDSACLCFNKALTILDSLKQDSTLLSARCLAGLAESLIKTGSLKNVEPFLLKSLAIKGRLEGRDDSDYLATYHTLGYLNKELERFETAKGIFKEILQIREQKGDTLRDEYGSTLNSLGNLLKAMYDFDQAEYYLEKSLAVYIQISGKYSRDCAMVMNNQATLYSAIGRNKEAEMKYKEALAIRERVYGKDHYLYAGSLINLAILYIGNGRYGEAEQYLLTAKKMFEDTKQTQHTYYSNCLNSLVVLYKNLGNYPKALAMSDRHMEVIESRKGKKSLEYANSLNSRANIFKNANEFAMAEQQYQMALEIIKEQRGVENSQYALCLMNLGNLYKRLNQFEKAEQYLFQALGIMQKTDGDIHVCLSNISAYYMGQKQYPQAKKYALQALNSVGQIYGGNLIEFSGYPEMLALCYWSLGQADSTAYYMRQTADLRRKKIFDLASFQSETELQTTLALASSGIMPVQNAALAFGNRTPELPESVYDFVLTRKGLIEQNMNALNLLSNTPEVSNTLTSWKALSAALIADASKPVSRRQPKTLTDTLQSRIEFLEKQLLQQMPDFVQLRRQISWQAVQNALKPDEAAIEFINFHSGDYSNLLTVLGDSILYAAILLRPGWPHPKMLFLCEQQQLDSLLRQSDPTSTVTHLYATRNIEPTKAANVSALYPMLWQPLDSLLQGVNTVYYAPSGLLHRVAFHAIPTGKPGEVLADRYRLYQLGSTRNLVVRPDSTHAANQPVSALLAGGIQYNIGKSRVSEAVPDTLDLSPNFSTLAVVEARKNARLQEPTRKTRGKDGFTYLPGTKKEVAQLEKLMLVQGIKTQVLLDTFATEEQIKKLGTTNPSPTILHLATHGFFFPDPAQKGVGISSESRFAQLEHPLLRSGLALAGANQTWNTGHPAPGREDGILTAYEIANMNLSGTQLAVLSACETGLGDIQGSEGVYGLQRAFKIAGVKRLIVTLWDVPDKQTAAFMSLFYEKWLGGLDIRTAFYDTQTAMRQRYKDPFVWAAFVLVE